MENSSLESFLFSQRRIVLKKVLGNFIKKHDIIAETIKLHEKIHNTFSRN